MQKGNVALNPINQLMKNGYMDHFPLVGKICWQFHLLEVLQMRRRLRYVDKKRTIVVESGGRIESSQSIKGEREREIMHPGVGQTKRTFERKEEGGCTHRTSGDEGRR